MQTIGRIGGFINRYLVLFTIGVAAFALMAPNVIMPLAHVEVGSFSITNVLLMLIMLGNGMSIDVSALKDMMMRPWLILVGLVVKYVAMAGGAYLVAKLFGFGGQIAFGLILLGCMPSGTASGVFISIAAGDVALCMTIVLLSTFLAPVVTPLLTFLLGGEWVSIDFWSMFQSILFVVLIPMVVGIVLRNRKTELCDRLRPLVGFVSSTSVLLIIAVCTAPNAEAILTLDSVMVIAALCVNFVIALFSAIGCVRLMRLDYGRSQAIVIATADLNTGLSSGIAATFSATYPMAVIPSIIYVPLNILLMTIAVKALAKGAPQDGGKEEEK